MPSPLSVDLRQRVVSAVWEGASCHQAATRFGVSVSSASRWSEQIRQEGRLAPKPSGGDHASHWIEAQADLDPTDLRGAAHNLPARVARCLGRARRADQHEQSVRLLRPARHHP